MGKPFGKASRRTFGRIGTLVPFPCWDSLGVMSSDTLKFSKQPPSEALKGGLPVSVLQLSGLGFLKELKCCHHSNLVTLHWARASPSKPNMAPMISEGFAVLPIPS